MKVPTKAQLIQQIRELKAGKNQLNEDIKNYVSTPVELRLENDVDRLATQVGELTQIVENQRRELNRRNIFINSKFGRLSYRIYKLFSNK